MKKRVLSAFLISALIASLASCGSGGGSATNGAAPSTGYGEKGFDGFIGDAEGASPGTAAPSYDADYAAGDYSYSDDFTAGSKDRYGDSFDEQRRAGLLTGGEWRDNSNFIFWRKLFEQRGDWADEIERWKLRVLDRVFVRVKDANGQPAAGMTVKLTEGSTILWETVTDSRGEAFLFGSIDPNVTRKPDKIIVEAADGRAVTAGVPENCAETDTAVEIAVPDSSPMRTKLDLMLMMDTTGSMGDELSYLQTELESVIDRVKDATGADLQLSVNFYRDTGDDYVVRDYGFTKNIGIALDHLEDQRARGGGDYPEAVTDAIGSGLYKHEWRADSEKIMLLVLDAPPHLDEGIVYMKSHIQKAAQMGVRIIPVASSGVDTDTEFLCRAMSIATGGTYTFLTDDSGIGNSHLEPTIGSYEVEKLNDMLVRIISDYFSQEPRRYNTQKPAETTQQQEVTGSANGRYPAAYICTYDYFGGEGMYTEGVIRSEDELDAFGDKYGFRIAENVDLSSSVIAYKVDMLSSGSIRIDDSKGVYCTVEGIKPVFHYELDIPEVGTTEIMTLFVYAELPASALSYRY